MKETNLDSIKTDIEVQLSRKDLDKNSRDLFFELKDHIKNLESLEKGIHETGTLVRERRFETPGKEFQEAYLSLNYEKKAYLQSILQSYEDVNEQSNEQNLIERYILSRNTLDSLRLCEHSQNRIRSILDFQKNILESGLGLKPDLTETRLENIQKIQETIVLSDQQQISASLINIVDEMRNEFRDRREVEKDLEYRRDYI